MTRTIPFDYAFQFELAGVPTNKVQDVVEISMQGVFVAVSIGYSFVLDERRTPRAFPPVVDAPVGPVLIPLFPGIVVESSPLFLIEDETLEGVFVIGTPGADISLIQLDGNAPVIIAGGKIEATGTLKIQAPLTARTICVWDRTNNIIGQPFEVGSPSTPTIGPNPSTLKLPAPGDKDVFIYGSRDDTVELVLMKGGAAPSGQLIDTPPQLTDRETFRNNTGIEVPFLNFETGITKAPLKIGGVETKLGPGDALVVRTQSAIGITFNTFSAPRAKPSTLTLGALTNGLESVNASLASGFRINPDFFSFVDADIPLDQIPGEILERAFEPGCGQDDVNFLYSIDVSSTGRELQNKPIHNIAGLGIANGDRPFRPFARPIALQPRSSIRIQVEELRTLPGTLYIVLQGYKMLGTGQIQE
jgi:hypothetical protein